MAPDFTAEPLNVIAWSRHGLLLRARIYGNLRDGGAFENVFLCVLLVSEGKRARALLR